MSSSLHFPRFAAPGFLRATAPGFLRSTAPGFLRSAADAATRVDLLGALFVLWGALTALIGCSTLALALGALTLLSPGGGPGGQIAASVTVAAFTSLALIAIVWGAAHVAVGLPLRRRRAWSRLGALMLGAVDLVLLPYGTALGCYALWTLLREDGRRLFPA